MLIETLFIAGILSCFIGGIVVALLATDHLQATIKKAMLNAVEEQYGFSNGRVRYCKRLPLSEADKLNNFVDKYAFDVSYVERINGVYEDKWLNLVIKIHKNDKIIIAKARVI